MRRRKKISIGPGMYLRDREALTLAGGGPRDPSDPELFPDANDASLWTPLGEASVEPGSENSMILGAENEWSGMFRLALPDGAEGRTFRVEFQVLDLVGEFGFYASASYSPPAPYGPGLWIDETGPYSYEFTATKTR